MDDFDGKTVAITGASGNLGRAVAEAFAARGANLVLVDRNAQHLGRAFGAESAQRMFAVVDLLDAQSVATMAAQAVARYGRIDALCNIAGGFRMGEPVHATTDATWQAMFDLNARTMLNAVRAVVPRMIAAGGGAVVNVGAHAAQKGAARMGAYTASKSVVIRLTETMAAELRDQGINVNCVLPTIIDTPENRASMPDADPSRWVAPQDLANVIVFLASPAARAIHGAAVPVTGLS
jgi:NAD(P)-dependent dehydrogenase (short-subunit alcohol dehydrogenase family)